jgi:hypothetical protein
MSFHLGGDPALGWVLPHGGAYHVPLQFLIFSIQLLPTNVGEGDGESLHSSSVPLQFLPPSSISDSDQCTMVGVVARHPDAYASESSTVGFPPEEVVTLRGDPSPLPPHPPPCPPPQEPFPRVLAEMSGHVDEVHGIHLLSNCLLSFCVWCPKIEVNIANKKWVCTGGACLLGSFNISQRFQVRKGI